MSLTKVSFSMIDGAAVNVMDFGAVGDGIANDTVAIQAAIDAASSTGATIYVPAGTYKLVPATPKNDEAGVNLAALIMKSNMHILGEIGTTFKIADNISSDASPTRFSAFLSIIPLSNISFQNLTFDMNGANNPISPLRPVSYNVFTQAAILFSGTSGGVAAHGDDVYIANCVFKNTAGVTSIGCMQSNSLNVELGKRWQIINNTFINNGLDTNDHSSVYLWSNEVLCHGNTFTADTMQGTVGQTGGICAIEIHGANQRITSNAVKNYYRAVYVATNYTSDAKNNVVADNSFGPLRGTGVEIERIQANGAPVREIVISNNVIELTDDSVPISYKPAFLLDTVYAITDVLITGNIVKKIGSTVPSALFGLDAATFPANLHDNISIVGNQATGVTFGMLMASNATNGFGNITFNNNEIFNMTGGGAFTVPAGVSGANLNASTAVKSLTISNNSFVDTRAVPLSQYGIQLSGLITNLYIGPQTYVGMTVAEYSESALTVTNRDGFYNSIPFTPILTGWTNVGTPSFTGTTYSRYGNTVTVNIVITPATSISATLTTSTITGLPFTPLTPVIASGAIIGTGAALDNCVVTAAGIVYPPTTGVTSVPIGFSFTYSAA